LHRLLSHGFTQNPKTMRAYSDGASPMAEQALKRQCSSYRRLIRTRLRAHLEQ